jgi:hypothetical protein
MISVELFTAIARKPKGAVARPPPAPKAVTVLLLDNEDELNQCFVFTNRKDLA